MLTLPYTVEDVKEQNTNSNNNTRLAPRRRFEYVRRPKFKRIFARVFRHLFRERFVLILRRRRGDDH